jgi:hypothetical protein
MAIGLTIMLKLDALHDKLEKITRNNE